jgi:hypothetical protein
MILPLTAVVQDTTLFVSRGRVCPVGLVVASNSVKDVTKSLVDAVAKNQTTTDNKRVRVFLRGVYHVQHLALGYTDAAMDNALNEVQADVSKLVYDSCLQSLPT